MVLCFIISYIDCICFFLAVVGCRSWGFPGNGHHIRKAKTELNAGQGALEFYVLRAA